MPKNAFNWYVCNPHEVGGGWTSKKACLINIQQRRPPRVLVMCLFIHPVQYKHFRATYTIHNSIIRQIWGLGNGRQLEEVVYKCKKYAGPFMFVWNAHNFAFLFLMFLFLLVNHSDSTQSMRPLLARLAKKENHQSRDFTSFDITIMIKFALGLRFKKQSPNHQNVLECLVQCINLPDIFVN